MTQEEFQILE